MNVFFANILIICNYSGLNVSDILNDFPAYDPRLKVRGIKETENLVRKQRVLV